MYLYLASAFLSPAQLPNHLNLPHSLPPPLIVKSSEPMKLNFHSRVLFLFFLFLISSRETSGRIIASRHGMEEIKANEITKVIVSIEETGESNNSFNQLMGMEDCEIADQECLKRRAISEVHLDYIYTQHHKP